MASRTLLRVSRARPILTPSTTARRNVQTDSTTPSAAASIPPTQRGFAPSANVQPIVVKQRGPGFFRGGIVGFLLGISLAGATAYVYLLDEYQQSSHSLLSSVEDLQRSTNKLKEHTKSIEKVEKEVKSLEGKAATKEEVEALRRELLKAIDDVNVSHLELKTQVWEIGQDVNAAKQRR
ncbi:hypothetical protein HK104_006090 [Borealophlyctis nickersoniae]|nr:hypothetical protein HK104_006090 [Borealophlyctis nickersoniae]